MIFHTAAEKVYYNAFFKNWHTSIKKIYPSARFSLRFVGPDDDTDVIEYCQSNDILLDIDPITYNQITDKFNVTGLNTNGYYAMSRWISVPTIDEDVFVTDIDIVAISAPSFDIEKSLNEKPWFTVSRRKANNRTLKLMAICLRKDICNSVRDKAISLLNSQPLVWSLDLNIRDFLMENFEYNEYVLLGSINKLSIPEVKKLPFAHVKGDTETKISEFKIAKSLGIF